MNAYAHAQLSVKRRGGSIDDYYAIHSFIDSTKELCSDNRHRLLHNLWGVRRVIVPRFGPSFMNSDGKRVNVKDLCEQDHILPDYANKFIPTLDDFVREFEELTPEELEGIEAIHAREDIDKDLLDLLLSPLTVTGHLKALRITHNGWFLNAIVPELFDRRAALKEFPVRPAQVFERMNFALWMDNGADFPASCAKTKAIL